MNKAAIEKFAVWARTKLISEITYKMGLLGITEKGIAEPLPQSTNDLQLFDIGTKNYAEVTGIAIKQRSALVDEIKRREKTSNYNTALTSVIEEVSYTWFNRLVAVRFMEVNDYLPSGVRVLSSENSAKSEPDLVTNPFDTDLEFTPFEQDRIIQLKDENKLDELFRMLFIKQCNKLHDILPELFEKTDDYTELLLTISFTDKDGVVYHLTHDIPESNFNVEKEGQVEIIGWMYQYYNTELKADTFAQLKKNVKITKERIPAATQLFTPDWIVRYMVENSLGRLWIEGHPNDSLKNEWKYYLDEAKQEESVIAELEKIRKQYQSINPEEIKIIDPCMGSGHILVYAFDVLMQIYESCGYTQRDAAKSIITNNIFGLDIDKRAYQLSYFALMMKARQYSRRIFNEDIKPNVFVIEDNSVLTADAIDYIAKGNQKIRSDLKSISDDLYNAKEYGSIIDVTPVDFEAIYRRLDEIRNSELDIFSAYIPEQVTPIIRQAEVMAQKYDVVVTNPPYMGASGMSAKLSDYVKTYYPDSKADMFAVFIERCGQMAKKNGYQAMITQHAWMFLSSFEKLRSKLLSVDIVNMAHLGARAFEEIGGEVVQTTSFVIRKSHVADYKGEYCRLIEPTTQQGKEDMFLAGENRYTADQSNFSKIPGSPVAYWMSENFIRIFEKSRPLSSFANVPKGLSSGSVDRFMRFWYEVNNTNINYECSDCSDTERSAEKWYPYAKGGAFRRWNGNLEYVVNWENNGFEVKNFVDDNGKQRSRPQNTAYYFKKCMTYSAITSYKLSLRYLNHCIFGGGGDSIHSVYDKYFNYLFAFVNTEVQARILKLISPTMNFEVDHIKKLPIIVDETGIGNVNQLVEENIKISGIDWDSYETSWDFKRNPLVKVQGSGDRDQWSVSTLSTNHYPLITNHYTNWKQECETRFQQLKSNEEELNRIFIDIYGLQDELTPEVADKDITVHRVFDSKDDVPESMKGSNYIRTMHDEIGSLVSYAVGCMFGRYSLDVDGIAYAGGAFSDRWVAVSDKYYKREVVEYYVGKELSRAFGMAEIHVGSGGDLSPCEAASERGAVWIIGSNAEGGSVNPFQYRRGTGKKLYEGICELSVDSKGVKCRAGNTAYDLCSPEILNAISSGNGNELVARGWKDANSIDWKTICCKLTTNHYSPDADNCLPVTDEEYFRDDIVGRFVEFIKVVYGEDTLEENLSFIANALGNKGNTSREIIRNYFLNDFMADHIKTYQKRPIYWLFDSGKQNGFKALVYMHRWNADTIGNMRVEYLHRMQRVYESEINRMQETIDNSSNGREVSAAEKRKDKLTKQLKETKDYDAKVAHLALSRIDIDLDDGVKVNYEKVQTADGKNMEILTKLK